MQMQRIALKTAPEIQRIIKLAFPSYRKRAAYLSPFRPTAINSYWDGGSRDEFVLVNLDTSRAVPLPTATHPYFDVAAKGLVNKSSDTISVDRVGNITLQQLPDNHALIQAGTFCGKPATARVLLNPVNITPMLEADHA
jgi:hypothetical protein